jgi:UTP-glucose-1-phosphate uridylyltransferase
MEPTLVILAAGMGSRYGGLKQIDTVGNNGESIIDFSIYDAIKAGFKHLVLIIRKEHEAAFEAQLTHKIRPFIDVKYVYQDMDVLPEGFVRPLEREKPWGTTHALLACKGKVQGPFAIINADDYYGPDSYQQIYQFLTQRVKPYEYGIVAYQINNTLSDHGSVTRGLCQQHDEWMSDIEEIQKIYRRDGKVFYEYNQNEIPLIGNEPVSMNYWGFDDSVFDLMEQVFRDFMLRDFELNPLKCEHVLPTAVKELLAQQKIKVRMMTCSDQWFGVTYRDDKPIVEQALLEKKNNGTYPFDLWEK